MEIRYKIQRLDEVGFSYKPDYDYTRVNQDSVSFQFSHTIVPNPEKEEVALTMRVEITPADSDIVLAEDAVYCTFLLSPFANVIKMSGDSFKMSEPVLMETFISVAIGALRGLLAKNLKGTPLMGFTLPLIPMAIIRQNFLQEQIVAE